MLPDLTHLISLAADTEAFEQERNRILSSYILSLPEDERHAAYALQLEIDTHRLLSDEDHLVYLARRLNENLLSLIDQNVRLVEVLRGPPAVKPVHER